MPHRAFCVCSMQRKAAFLLIDVQNDFCPPDGSLAVAEGAVSKYHPYTHSGAMQARRPFGFKSLPRSMLWLNYLALLRCVHTGTDIIPIINDLREKVSQHFGYPKYHGLLITLICHRALLWCLL